MNQSTTIQSAMNESGRKAFKGLAFALSVMVYLAGLLYAGVRSYSLFAATFDTSLLAVAVLGIVALEVSALALPLAIHFWTAPGQQRLIAYGFYALDLALIVGNSILDAAHHSGTVLPTFMSAYGVFAVPGLPVICMIGWTLIWTLDPVSKQHDMEATVKSATHEALLSKIQEAMGDIDINDSVNLTANEYARTIVSETLGQAPRRKELPAQAPAPALPAYRYNTDVPTIPPVEEAIADIQRRNTDELPTGGYPALSKKNGHRRSEGETGPKA